MKGNMTLQKWEKTSVDKAVDKKMGYKKGSIRDRRADKKVNQEAETREKLRAMRTKKK